jgi:hypothetical protein
MGEEKQWVEFMGFKIESQLELHLMRQVPALTQVCCILINGLRKIQGMQLNGKNNSPAYASQFKRQSKN